MSWTREALARRSHLQVAAIADRALNRLCKWRSVFAGWQLGTRLDSDPEAQAVRDHRETTLLLRVEASALTRLLVDAGVFSARDFTEQVIVEAEALDAMLATKFPGFQSSDHGITIDIAVARETMRGWRP